MIVRGKGENTRYLLVPGLSPLGDGWCYLQRQKARHDWGEAGLEAEWRTTLYAQWV